MDGGLSPPPVSGPTARSWPGSGAPCLPGPRARPAEATPGLGRPRSRRRPRRTGSGTAPSPRRPVRPSTRRRRAQGCMNTGSPGPRRRLRSARTIGLFAYVWPRSRPPAGRGDAGLARRVDLGAPGLLGRQSHHLWLRRQPRAPAHGRTPGRRALDSAHGAGPGGGSGRPDRHGHGLFPLWRPGALWDARRASLLAGARMAGRLRTGFDLRSQRWRPPGRAWACFR